MSVVTAHMIYFCAFTRSDIFPKNARKLGVGRRQFDAGVNGLSHLIMWEAKINYPLDQLTYIVIIEI